MLLCERAARCVILTKSSQHVVSLGNRNTKEYFRRDDVFGGLFESFSVVVDVLMFDRRIRFKVVCIR